VAPVLRRCRLRLALVLAATVAALVLPLPPAPGGVDTVAAEPASSMPAPADRLDGGPASLPSRSAPVHADRRTDPPLRGLWVPAILVAAATAAVAAATRAPGPVRTTVAPRAVRRWTAPVWRAPPLRAA
jgi:hypothetical protein